MAHWSRKQTHSKMKGSIFRNQDRSRKRGSNLGGWHQRFFLMGAQHP